MKYFIHFNMRMGKNNGDGYYVINRKKKISSIDDFTEISNEIGCKYAVENVIVTNFKLLDGISSSDRSKLIKKFLDETMDADTDADECALFSKEGLQDLISDAIDFIDEQ